MAKKIIENILRVNTAGIWLFKLGKPILHYVLVITVFGVLMSLASVGMAIVAKSFIDTAVSRDGSGMLRYAIIFAGIILTLLGLNIVTTLASVWIGEKVSNTIREKLFTNITKAEWIKVASYHSGDLLTRLTSDAGTVSGFYLGVVPGIISLTAQLVAAFIALYTMAPTLALLAFLLGPLALLASRLFAGKLGRLHRLMQETEGKYRSFMTETIQNLLVMKSFGLENHSVKIMKDFQNERLGYVLSRNKLGLGLSTALSIGYWSGYFLAFFWGGMGLVAGTVTFGTLTAFLQLIGQIQSPFMDLANTFPKIIAVIISCERLMEIEGIPAEDMTDSDNITPDWESAGITFENVSYYYEDGKHIINEANFSIKPGEIIGVVGPSGEGKTTLIRLLLAMVRPVKGKVYLSAQSGERITSGAVSRKLISYVPQGNSLYSGTIRDNILKGCMQAGQDDIDCAAEAACALEFINELPEGINTAIGENGLGISEGQAQRIAIARALIRKAPILVLDEATSALDSVTELKVLDAIRRLKPQRTCIIVTHRKSSLELCSRVFRIEEGVVKELERASAYG